MNLGRFVHLRSQGASIDTSIANDMGGNAGTVQTTGSSAPWEAAQPYLKQIFQGAQQNYQRGPYGGPYIANQSPYSTQAINSLAQRAQAGSPLTNAAQGQAQKTIQGDYLSAGSNPYLSGAVQQAMDQVRSNVNSQFRGDNYGNSAHQEWLTKQLAGTALPIYADNYNRERQNQLNTMMGAPSLAATDYADISQLGAAGQAQENRGQQEIQAAQQQFYSPWDVLQRYQQGIAGSAAGGQTTQQTPYFTNPMANALGLGIGGLTLYSGLRGLLA